MPIKRKKSKARTHTVPPALRASAERLVELDEAHMAAIRGGDQSFYVDGRHEELVTLLPVINEALGIKPWEDGHALLREALEAKTAANDGPLGR